MLSEPSRDPPRAEAHGAIKVPSCNHQDRDFWHFLKGCPANQSMLAVTSLRDSSARRHHRALGISPPAVIRQNPTKPTPRDIREFTDRPIDWLRLGAPLGWLSRAVPGGAAGSRAGARLGDPRLNDHPGAECPGSRR